jgi:TM2 domain-containing membrane protein YozV
MNANFCKNCGTHLEPDVLFCTKCGEKIDKNQADKNNTLSSTKQSQKSPIVTLLLCLFFGVFGFHRFYVGKIGTGLLMLITAGGLGIWYLVDLIFIVSNKFEDKHGNNIALTKNLTSSKKTMMIISAIVAWFLVFFGTIFLVAMYLTSGLLYPVQSQLKSLQSGNVEKAYSYTSKDFQKVTSLEHFKQFLNQYPSLKNNESSFFNEREIQNNTGFLKGTLTSKDGAKTPIEYRLIYEDGAWKIMGIQVSPTGAGTKINDNSSSTNSLSNVYEDKSNKYSIKYPDDWKYENTEKGTVLFRGKEGTPSYYTTINIQTILAKKSGGKFSNTKELVDDLKMQLSKASFKAKILKQGELKLSTNLKRFHGEYLIFTYNYNKIAFKQIQFVIFRDDETALYTWAYTAPAKIFNMNLPIVKAMYQSWSID